MEEVSDKKGKVSVTETWVKKHHLVYTGAARHPFIHSIRDATIHLSSFKTWLGQVYIFVMRCFVPFVASVLVKASKQSNDIDDDDVELILGDLAALHEEIAWYKEQASILGIHLSNLVPNPNNPNQDYYFKFMKGLMREEVEYPVAVTALWAIERVYEDGFSHCLEEGNKTPGELVGTCQRWGNQSFRNYCDSVAKIVDRCLDDENEDVKMKAEATFLDVLQLELQFRNSSVLGST